MKSIYCLLILFQLRSCENKRSDKQISSNYVQNNVEKPIYSDTINGDENNLNESVNKYPELKIYSVTSFDKTENQPTGFISLTDSYPWSENNDSLVVSEEYLGNEEIKNFHILNKKYRDRFLNRIKVKETDKVFIYNYHLDSIYTFQVKDLPLLAQITIYGADPPIKQEDYLIGFDLQNILPMKNVKGYSDALVYVGDENPFDKGKMKPIIWKKIDANLFPKEAESKRISTSKINKLYIFQMNNMDYYLANNNHLVILESKTKKMILDEIFTEGESASLAPLSFADNKNENSREQWTGVLFKNKPPVFLGFLYESFGCTGIDFIENPRSRIYISCDCRH